jgi:hypothetical protein
VSELSADAVLSRLGVPVELRDPESFPPLVDLIESFREHIRDHASAPIWARGMSTQQECLAGVAAAYYALRELGIDSLAVLSALELVMPPSWLPKSGELIDQLTRPAVLVVTDISRELLANDQCRLVLTATCYRRSRLAWSVPAGSVLLPTSVKVTALFGDIDPRDLLAILRLSRSEP